MSNIEIVKDNSQLNKIFELAQDKLVILLFYTKSNANCKYAKKSFENLSIKHTVSIFVLIDMDIFVGDNPYIKGINSYPIFIFYYQNSRIGSWPGHDQIELDKTIMTAQQFVMNNINQRSQNQANHQNQNQYQNQTQNQISQSYNQQQNMTYSQNNFSQNTRQNHQQVPQPTQSNFSQSQAQPEINNIIVPTFHQMQQMFQIWETMH